MPYGDRTGPMGRGLMTGRMLGYGTGNPRPGHDIQGIFGRMRMMIKRFFRI